MPEMNNKSIIIGTSALKLDLNNGGLYDAVLKSRQMLELQAKASDAKILPFQQNIAIIQQIYLALTKETNIPLSGVTVSFIDDEWDFTAKYKAGKTVSNYRFDFNYLGTQTLNLPDYMKTVLKLYVIYIITEFGIDCGTNQAKVTEVKKLMLHLIDNNKYMLEALKLDDLKSLYAKTDILYKTMVARRRHIQTFLVFYSFLTGHDIYSKEIDEWCKDIDTKQINAHIAENKTVCPPTEFYQKYTEYHYNRVFDTSVRMFERGVSGLLYIGSQTGLRGAELTILTKDCIEVFRLDDQNGLKRLSYNELENLSFGEEQNSDVKYVGILHYRTTKNGGRRGNPYTNGETNASQKVIRVVLALRVLFAKEREVHNTNALVPNEDSSFRRSNAEYRPHMTETKLMNYSKRSCIQNAASWDLIDSSEAELYEGHVMYASNDYKTIQRNQQYTIADMEQGGVNIGQTVSYITLKQFRVYVASDLHARGVDDRTISYLLNHHSTEMWGYYVRESHPIQEDIDFSREIVSEVVRDHTKILGPKGEAYEKRIEEIILNHELNVQKDLDAVIDTVCGEMPIRAKVGGFCIKANPDRDCWYDGVTNEFMCAYGCCPNHCHMYFMAPVSLQKARSIAKAMEYNLACEYVNAAEKEAFKLKTCLDNELTIELQEMQRENAEHGTDWVIARHPETKSVIDNMNSIFEEITEWRKQIKQLLSTMC